MSPTGKIGESLLYHWCAQVGLVATKPDEDKNGWDFLVEFPRFESSDPVGARKPQLMCMVQVKTTAVDERSAPIKLSNWERMITLGVPWFVFAVALDGKTPKAAYLVHVDKDHIERVQRRLREIRVEHADASVVRLHDHEMAVTWNEGDRLEAMTGLGPVRKPTATGRRPRA